jgi:hypothetical protein
MHHGSTLINQFQFFGPKVHCIRTHQCPQTISSCMQAEHVPNSLVACNVVQFAGPFTCSRVAGGVARLMSPFPLPLSCQTGGCAICLEPAPRDPPRAAPTSAAPRGQAPFWQNDIVISLILACLILSQPTAIITAGSDHCWHLALSGAMIVLLVDTPIYVQARPPYSTQSAWR